MGISASKMAASSPSSVLTGAFFPKWKLISIFPFDYAIQYHFAKDWFTKVSYASFGGPYRYPRRVTHGLGKYALGIFEVYSNGVVWDLIYRYGHLLTAKIGAGWNFGGSDIN